MDGQEAGAVARNDAIPLRDMRARLGGDGRLTTYRTASGKLMCRSQAGLLCSDVPVLASRCGNDHGCDGRWSCLTALLKS